MWPKCIFLTGLGGKQNGFDFVTGNIFLMRSMKDKPCLNGLLRLGTITVIN